MGFAILHLLNISRTIVLSFVIIYTDSFDFMHEFVFRVLFYGTTFVLWYFWIKKYVDHKKSDSEPTAKQNPENITD